MNIGFETIANATILAYDSGQTILVTDPWLQGSAYFGSWRLFHEVPDRMLEAARRSKYVWFSHGHPDHLNADSLPLFKGSTILLPDHYKGRIARDLIGYGWNVTILEDRKWVTLSEHIKILCIADYNQDGILLIDINGRLVIDLNDARDRGWGATVQKMASRYEKSFLLCLSGYGDADMIHYYEEDGRPIPPPAAKRFPVGPRIAQQVESFRVKYFIPFSSMHRYQREDSVWANEYVPRLTDYEEQFSSKTAQILPAYISYDCETDKFVPIQPKENKARIVPAKEFGDDWSELLTAADRRLAESYFKAIEYLGTYLDFVNLRVGGKDNPISLGKRNFRRGVTFEVPRHSLMVAIQHEIFDDLLIGNFMKTTLHGRWPKSKLYPDFTPYVAKFADNGRAKSLEELREYFDAYRRRWPMEYLRHRFEERCINIFRSYVPNDSSLYQMGNRAFWKVRRGLATMIPEKRDK